MKLHPVHLPALDRAGERYDVGRHGGRLISDWRRVRMREIDLRPVSDALEQPRRARKLELVPTNVWHFVRPFRFELLALAAHQREPLAIGSLAAPFEQPLQSQADAKQRTPAFDHADDRLAPFGAKRRRLLKVAHARNDDPLDVIEI